MSSSSAAPPPSGSEVRQRNVATDSTTEQVTNPPKDAASPAPAAPATPGPAARTDGSVWRTFSLFSVAMFALPIAALYGSKDTLFGGNINYAGGLAAVVANVVLIAYVVVCFNDSDGTVAPPAPPKEQGKDQ